MASQISNKFNQELPTGSRQSLQPLASAADSLFQRGDENQEGAVGRVLEALKNVASNTRQKTEQKYD